MFEDLKELLESASEEELQELIDFTDISADQYNGITLQCILKFQEIVNEQLEKSSRSEDAVYVLIRENARGESSKNGTLSELIDDHKGWLESYLPSKHKSRVYNISSIEELVELLNLSYEGTYWSDTEYSFDLV
ncbi:MAG: hypothetical protein ACRC0X_09305 [Brevinema sp.]